ncbi:MAG: hypothetical protein ACK5WP_09115 [Neisseriaceae bacterium]
MNNYELCFSITLKNKNNISYDVIHYNNAYYAGYDLFKSFIYFLDNNKNYPVKIFKDCFALNKHISSII